MKKTLVKDAIRYHKGIARAARRYPNGKLAKLIVDTGEKSPGFTLVKDWDVPDLIVAAFLAGAVWSTKKKGQNK